jgi:hypothetical protein
MAEEMYKINKIQVHLFDDWKTFLKKKEEKCLFFSSSFKTSSIRNRDSISYAKFYEKFLREG